jgi:hypothetical protein
VNSPPPSRLAAALGGAVEVSGALYVRAVDDVTGTAARRVCSTTQ